MGMFGQEQSFQCFGGLGFLLQECFSGTAFLLPILKVLG